MSDRNETSTLNGVFNIVPIHCNGNPIQCCLCGHCLPLLHLNKQFVLRHGLVPHPIFCSLPPWPEPALGLIDLIWQRRHGGPLTHRSDDRNLALMTQSYELQWQFCWKFSRSLITPRTPLQIPLVSEPNKQIPELLTINGLRVWCLCETLVPAWV